jgi:hypothetical protein
MTTRNWLFLIAVTSTIAVSLLWSWRITSAAPRAAQMPLVASPAHGTALLDERVPPDCNPDAGSPGAVIDAPGTVPPVLEGQQIYYRLRVLYLEDPSEVLCQGFDVDVWIRLPGDSVWQLVCTLPVMNEGDRLTCPDLVPYTADGTDRRSGILQAFMFAIGDKHLGPDCITSPDDPNTPPLGPICFGALLTNSLVMRNTPTPTATPTVTPSSTPTPPPSPCARADVNGDDKVTVADLVAVATHLLARRSYNAQVDANSDGKVSVKDLLVVLICRTR